MITSRVNEEKSASIQNLEDLAESHYGYASVGLIQYSRDQGSGVYLGNQIVLTTAHCIPDEIPNNQFISSNAHYGTFTLEKENSYHYHAKIIWVNRHPNYIQGKYFSYPVGRKFFLSIHRFSLFLNFFSYIVAFTVCDV